MSKNLQDFQTLQVPPIPSNSQTNSEKRKRTSLDISLESSAQPKKVCETLNRSSKTEVCSFCNCLIYSKFHLQQHIKFKHPTQKSSSSQNPTIQQDEPGNSGSKNPELGQDEPGTSGSKNPELGQDEPGNSGSKNPELRQDKPGNSGSENLELRQDKPGNSGSENLELRQDERETCGESSVLIPGTLCVICDERFPSILELKKHLSAHGKAVMFRCSVCRYKSNSSSRILTHIRERHTARDQPAIQLVSAQHVCRECCRSFEAEQQLTFHTKQAHTLEMHCSLCEATFRAIPALQAHFTMQHGEESWKNNLNAICEEASEKLLFLKQDPSSCKFQCFLCPAVFNVKIVLRNHIGANHLCGGEFSASAEPHAESDQNHVGANLTFKYVTGPLNQQSVKTPSNIMIMIPKSDRPAEKPSTSEGPGTYQCALCKLKVSRYRELSEHMHRFHCSSIPYFCSACEGWFAHKYSQEAHWYQQHEKTRPQFAMAAPDHQLFGQGFVTCFPCKFCNLYLTSEALRQEHQARNHPEIFICLTCSFACEHVQSALDHVMVVHADSKTPKIMHKKTAKDSTEEKVTYSNSLPSKPPPSVSAIVIEPFKASSVKLETGRSDLASFEYVECSSISQQSALIKQESLNVEDHHALAMDSTSAGSDLQSTVPSPTFTNFESTAFDPLLFQNESAGFTPQVEGGYETRPVDPSFVKQASTSDPAPDVTGTEFHSSPVVPQGESNPKHEISREKISGISTGDKNAKRSKLHSGSLTNSRDGTLAIKEELEDVTIKQEFVPTEDAILCEVSCEETPVPCTATEVELMKQEDQMSETDVELPGSSEKPAVSSDGGRRVTCRPYPDSLPPVPGGCLPCSVQL